MGLCSRALRARVELRNDFWSNGDMEYLVQYIENTSWKVLAYGIYARSGAARCNKRRESWRETHTPLWLLIGRIIFITREKTSFAILIGRIIFLTCENHRSLLRLARTNLRTKIYDIAFWCVFLSMYIIIAYNCREPFFWLKFSKR